MAAFAIDLVLPCGPEAIGAARNSLDGLTDVMTAPVLEDARLIVSELVTNCVRHAGLKPGDPIRVRAMPDGDRLRLEVSDAGRGFRLSGPPQPSNGSGWGLFLVDRIAARWGVLRDPVTVVWAELDGTPAEVGFSGPAAG